MNMRKQVYPPDMTDVLENFKNDLFKSFNSINIGVINSFDKDNQTAEIRLVIKSVVKENQDGSKEIRERPVLLECPCFVLSGGSASIRMPIVKGDHCIVLFNDRDIDNWFTAGDGLSPNTKRTHDLSDGIALVGIRNLQTAITDFIENQITLQYDTNDIIEIMENRINIKSPEVYIGESDFEFICKSKKVSDWIDQKIATVFNGHTHPTPAEALAVNPAGTTPVAAPNQTMDSPSEADVASEAHKVGD